MSLDEAIDTTGRARYDCLQYCNFELNMRTKKYFPALDEAGGIFCNRWGDGPICKMAVHMLLKPQ